VEHFSFEDKITHGEWDSNFYHGFAAELSSNAVDLLRSHPDVLHIEEDGFVKVSPLHILDVTVATLFAIDIDCRARHSTKFTLGT
jgi:hypothetical protein